MEDLTMLTLILKGRLLTPRPHVPCGGALNKGPWINKIIK